MSDEVRSTELAAITVSVLYDESGRSRITVVLKINSDSVLFMFLSSLSRYYFFQNYIFNQSK